MQLLHYILENSAACKQFSPNNSFVWLIIWRELLSPLPPFKCSPVFPVLPVCLGHYSIHHSGGKRKMGSSSKYTETSRFSKWGKCDCSQGFALATFYVSKPQGMHINQVFVQGFISWQTQMADTMLPCTHTQALDVPGGCFSDRHFQIADFNPLLLTVKRNL